VLFHERPHPPLEEAALISVHQLRLPFSHTQAKGMETIGPLVARKNELFKPIRSKSGQHPRRSKKCFASINFCKR
jgi:hypothetical protein